MVGSGPDEPETAVGPWQRLLAYHPALSQVEMVLFSPSQAHTLAGTTRKTSFSLAAASRHGLCSPASGFEHEGCACVARLPQT